MRKINKKRTKNQFQRGIQQVLIDIIIGFSVTAAIATFVQTGAIPALLGWVLSAAVLLGILATMKKYQKFTNLFTIGWIIGAVIFKDLLGPIDYIIYIILPGILLTLRLYQFIQKHRRSSR